MGGGGGGTREHLMKEIHRDLFLCIKLLQEGTKAVGKVLWTWI